MQNASLPAEKIVDGVTVKKVNIEEFLQIMEKIENVPGLLDGADLSNLDLSNIFSFISRFMRSALPDLIEVMMICSDVDREKAKQLSPVEFVRIVKAIIQLNDFFSLWTELKDLIPEKTKAAWGATLEKVTEIQKTKAQKKS